MMGDAASKIILLISGNQESFQVLTHCFVKKGFLGTAGSVNMSSCAK